MSRIQIFCIFAAHGNHCIKFFPGIHNIKRFIKPHTVIAVENLISTPTVLKFIHRSPDKAPITGIAAVLTKQCDVFKSIIRTLHGHVTTGLFEGKCGIDRIFRHSLYFPLHKKEAGIRSKAPTILELGTDHHHCHRIQRKCFLYRFLLVTLQVSGADQLHSKIMILKISFQAGIQVMITFEINLWQNHANPPGFSGPKLLSLTVNLIAHLSGNPLHQLDLLCTDISPLIQHI